MMLETIDNVGLVAVKKLSKGRVYIYEDGERRYHHGTSSLAAQTAKKETQSGGDNTVSKSHKISAQSIFLATFKDRTLTSTALEVSYWRGVLDTLECLEISGSADAGTNPNPYLQTRMGAAADRLAEIQWDMGRDEAEKLWHRYNG